ncbi:MAG TPA: hypothetical protein VM368_01345 [Flavisolibacter sp.]|nr:hypothetical protein [Flavisolibacter sp.]
MYIHSLVKKKPVVISIPTNPARLVITDGFHITKPINLVYSNSRVQYYKVRCAIEDDQLIVGLIIMLVTYAMGATSGSILFQLFSLFPIFYFLFLYYINRKDFIRFVPA